MDVAIAERGTGEITPTGAVESCGGGPDQTARARTGDESESARRALGLRVTEDRVLIKADADDHAPTLTEAGLYLATSLAAAVEGEDPAESWFVGTIVQLGPHANRLDVRRTMLKWLLDMEAHGTDVALAEIVALRQKVEDSPTWQPERLEVGNRVCFSWSAGQQITVGEERFVIVRAHEVLAVLEEDEEIVNA